MLQNGEFGKLKKKRPQGDLLQNRMKSMSDVVKKKKKKEKKEKKRKKRPSLMIIRDPSTTTSTETKQSQEEKRKEAARKIREFEQSEKIQKQPPRKQARKGSSSLSFLNQKNLDTVKTAKSRHVNSYVFSRVILHKEH